MRRLLFLAGLLALLLPGPARAETGTVVMRVPNCPYYVVSLPGGFALLKWFGGHNPAPGEQVTGSLGGFGMRTIEGQAGMQGTAWVEDFSIGGDAVSRKMYERCALGFR